ncbi:9413_t:CDS:2, partial [Ambispora leptoticha]
MILFVVLRSGEKITLTVSGDHTVESVKQQIQQREGTIQHEKVKMARVLLVAHSETCLIGIPVNKQRLVYLFEELHNERKLDDYDFRSEGTMFLCMTLFVVVLLGKTITLTVFADDTVESVKKKICDREGIPVEEQRLVYTTKELNNDQLKLSDYGFQNEGTMYLSLRLFG